MNREIDLKTAVFIIIADTIGTGIFVTTGVVLGLTFNASAVLLLWAIGGLVAITGSACYAELASIWSDNGGEYIYLKNIFGLLPSFLTGWVSLVVGFTGSIAITSLAAVWYFNNAFGEIALTNEWSQKAAACGLIFILGLIHIIGVRKGSLILNGLTIAKLGIVFCLIFGSFFLADWSHVERLTMDYPPTKDIQVVNYGFALLIIMFAYSGWNGATYIAGEIRNPERNLPIALITAAVIISAIYLLMNVVFLISAPGEELMNQKAVAAFAFGALFGEGFAPLFNIGVMIILLSSISAQMMLGPRVYSAMANDHVIFSSLSDLHQKFGTPTKAIVLQMIIAAIYVMLGSDSIESLLGYMGFALGIFPLFSVTGLVIVRLKNKGRLGTFRTPLFPLIPAIHIVLVLAMMTTSLLIWTKTSLISLGVVLAGIPIYFIWKKLIST